VKEVDMPIQKLKKFLDDNGIKYVSMQHSAAYTAQEVAALAHIPGELMAKTVMVKIDGKMAMAVVPASHQIDFDRLREVAGAESVELASEEEFKDYFPACDVGAMPPFGNLYDMPVYCANALSEDVEIAFSAGSHSELIRLSFADYEQLVQPEIASFSKRVP
jgi:Ala-tRNA(Pro) deacylase